MKLILNSPIGLVVLVCIAGVSKKFTIIIYEFKDRGLVATPAVNNIFKQTIS